LWTFVDLPLSLISNRLFSRFVEQNMNIASATCRNWFYLLLPIWALASWRLRSSHPWGAEPALGEAIALFDWCVFVPATFAICYRGMPSRALALRVLALVCSGIWVAGKIVPHDAQNLLQETGGIRLAGLSIMVLFEVAATAAMLRVVFGAVPDQRALEQQGLPPLIAKLMIAEARFWRWVWTRLSGK
jgi:hypothetical protein